MTNGGTRGRRGRSSNGPVIVGLVVLALMAGLGVGAIAAGTVGPSQGVAAATGSRGPSAAPASATPPATPTAVASPIGTPGATPVPIPTPSPTPELVAAPLDGVLVSPQAARRHPIAVMIDDLSAARPQSGFSAASVVWHAPAEGGIPRYMLVFQEQLPENGLQAVGPVRSARYYYIAWAAEWHAVYVHVGGSPQALSTLQSQGRGQLVYNADEFRWGGTYLWRITQRAAPHNVYTDGDHLRKLARAVKATDGELEPGWTFAPDTPLRSRPVGGRIEVGYSANHIRYDYDRATNTYLRSVTGEKQQKDAATGERVAPKNVVVMLMHFGPLNDGHPEKKRLEADVVGKGTAWISTNGRTIKGTWRKDALTEPTRFYDAKGRPVTLTVGQTFVQVLQKGSPVTIVAGTAPPVPGRPSQFES